MNIFRVDFLILVIVLFRVKLGYLLFNEFVKIEDA